MELNRDYENYVVSFKLNIKDADVTVDCEVPTDDREFLNDVRSRAFDFAQLIASQLTFQSGMSFTVILEDFIDHDGTHHPIHLGSSDLGKLSTVLSLDEKGVLNGFNDVMRVIGQDPQATFAFNELAMCLANPDLTAIHCARMVDALRHLVTPGDAKDSKIWERFRTELHLDQSFLQRITEESKRPRHGQRCNLRIGQRLDLMRRCWIIMNRYIEYRKRGGNLPEIEFPVEMGGPADIALVKKAIRGSRSRANGAG